MLLDLCWRQVDNVEVFQLLLSRAYTQSTFSVSHTTHQGVAWGCTRSWEGTQLGQLTQVISGIIHNMWLPGRGRRKIGSFRVRVFVLTVIHDGALLSWRWQNTSLAGGSGEWMPYFALLCLCKQLLLHLLNCLSLNPWVFSLLQLPACPSIRERGREWAALGCWVVTWSQTQPWVSFLPHSAPASFASPESAGVETCNVPSAGWHSLTGCDTTPLICHLPLHHYTMCSIPS